MFKTLYEYFNISQENLEKIFLSSDTDYPYTGQIFIKHADQKNIPDDMKAYH